MDVGRRGENACRHEGVKGPGGWGVNAEPLPASTGVPRPTLTLMHTVSCLVQELIWQHGLFGGDG
jgi:hypothetical protein